MSLPLLLLLASAWLSITAPLAAVAKEPAAAVRDGSRDFDWELGRWKTHVRRLTRPLSGETNWVELDGTSVVRPIAGGKANVVELDIAGRAGGIHGISLRLYEVETGRWSLNFVNLLDGLLTPPVTGGFKDGRGEFYGADTFDGKPILVRFLILDITARSARFEQSFSANGGKTWELNWVAVDTKEPDAGGAGRDPLPTAAASVTTAARGASDAVADPSRPAEDRARDGNRKPAAVLEFIGARPGDKIADYASGTGYFTRLFSSVVGPQGHVYASVPSELFVFPNIVKGIGDTQLWAAKRPNVSVTMASAIRSLDYPEPLDVFWISQNYHDLLDDFMGPVDINAFNRAVYRALRPGGLYVVLDHVAAKGSAADVTDTLHRIEPGVVRRQIEAAGFEFVGESKALANPADPHTAGPFDPSIRGRTDQFLFKFRKPLR